MVSVSPIKQSPIAKYLTENRAITKRDGNVWHFFNKEGLYLGRQIKIEQNGISSYFREIFGEQFKRLFYECKVISEQCAYIRDELSPLGISIATVKSCLQTISVDYLINKIKSTQKVKELVNKQELIAVDSNTGVGIYDIQRPFLYKETKTNDKIEELKKGYKIKHTLN